MKIGIVSDTHGMAKRLAAAIEMLTQRGAEALVHCGDVGSVECVELLGAAAAPAYMVAGNMDRRTAPLANAAANRGVTFNPDVVEVDLGGGRLLAAAHGHDPAALARLIAGGRFEYVCHGHTHRVRDEQVGRVRVINPGAVYNCRRPAHPTVALLDTGPQTLEFIEVPRQAEHVAGSR